MKVRELLEALDGHDAEMEVRAVAPGIGDVAVLELDFEEDEDGRFVLLSLEEPDVVQVVGR